MVGTEAATFRYRHVRMPGKTILLKVRRACRSVPVSRLLNEHTTRPRAGCSCWRWSHCLCSRERDWQADHFRYRVRCCLVVCLAASYPSALTRPGCFYSPDAVVRDTNKPLAECVTPNADKVLAEFAQHVLDEVRVRGVARSMLCVGLTPATCAAAATSTAHTQ